MSKDLSYAILEKTNSFPLALGQSNCFCHLLNNENTINDQSYPYFVPGGTIQGKI